MVGVGESWDYVSVQCVEECAQWRCPLVPLEEEDAEEDTGHECQEDFPDEDNQEDGDQWGEGGEPEWVVADLALLGCGDEELCALGTGVDQCRPVCKRVVVEVVGGIGGCGGEGVVALCD